MKHFFQYLLQKPPIYLQFWAYVYANTDDAGVYQESIPIVLSKFKVPKSTLHRILSYGVSWNGNGTIVEREWNNNVLKIKILDKVGGTLVEQQWNEDGTKKRSKRVSKKQVKEVETSDTNYQPSTESKDKAPPVKLYPKMIEIYNEFCIKRIGVGAKMDAHQGKCMKTIIVYIATQVKMKKGEQLTEAELNEGILSAWEYILSKWDLIKGFYAEQIKLSQINANLPNILMQLKTNKTNNRDAKFNTIKDEIGNVNFDDAQ